MKVQWADEEPKFLDYPKNSGRKFYRFAAELRLRPGEWAKYPGNYSRSRDSARSIAAGINSGRRPTFPSSQFEARIDIHSEVWVRAVR